MITNTKKLDYYMQLPYTKIATFCDDESGKYYISEVVELKGCSSTGDTANEALECLQEAMECWLESAIAYNDPIPEPIKTSDFFEKLLLPLPKLLYQKITEQAHAEGITLNQHIVQKLSQ
ncbi:MAG: type II toxin-antitoxin system HicB family antitoxin [Defluviitaleaceae bacterium]|nr:type II toxin-antitoxin system HicB family antitoxin [Defluviitaleaceae bacterium]